MNQPEGRKHDGWEEVARLRLITIELRDAEITRLNGTLAAIEAALNCDISGLDAETAARKLYHEHAAAQSKLSEAKEGGP